VEQCTPASNGRRRRPYHGEQVRALAARGRNEVVAKMKALLVRCGGQNARHRRACVRAVAEKSRLVAAAVRGEGRSDWRSEGGRALRLA
jgi:hypothetical protein